VFNGSQTVNRDKRDSCWGGLQEASEGSSGEGTDYLCNAVNWGPIHERSQTAVARATSANVVANDFATSHVIHETNRTCDHRKFGRKLTQNLRRTFRCRK